MRPPTNGVRVCKKQQQLDYFEEKKNRPYYNGQVTE